MPLDDLIPLKRVAALLGISRASLWRARKSSAVGFPKPVTRGKRLFWPAANLEALRQAVSRYEGRGAFEREQRYTRMRAALERVRVKRRRARPGGESEGGKGQGDMFD